MDNPGHEAAGKLGAYTYGAPGERSIADVLKDIASNLQEIVRSEIRLAKLEITGEGRKAIAASGMLAAGAVLALFGLGYVLTAALFALEIVLPNWAAGLIWGAILLICGGIAARAGKARFKTINPPRKTIQTVKEDVEWIKEQPKS